MVATRIAVLGGSHFRGRQGLSMGGYDGLDDVRWLPCLRVAMFECCKMGRIHV